MCGWKNPRDPTKISTPNAADSHGDESHGRRVKHHLKNTSKMKLDRSRLRSEWEVINILSCFVFFLEKYYKVGISGQ